MSGPGPWHVLDAGEPVSQHDAVEAARGALADLVEKRVVGLPADRRDAAWAQRQQVLAGERNEVYVFDGGWWTYGIRQLLAVRVTCLRASDRWFGPIHFAHIAEAWESTLRTAAWHHGGATITVHPYDMERKHEAGHLPQDAMALAEMIQQEPAPAPFPDLLHRLQAEHGYDQAGAAWRAACNWLAELEEEAEA